MLREGRFPDNPIFNDTYSLVHLNVGIAVFQPLNMTFYKYSTIPTSILFERISVKL